MCIRKGERVRDSMRQRVRGGHRERERVSDRDRETEREREREKEREEDQITKAMLNRCSHVYMSNVRKLTNVHLRAKTFT